MTILQGLAACGLSLCAAWKGETGDDRLFFTYATASGAWTEPITTIPGNSSVGPALAATDLTLYKATQSTLFAAWKGENSDNRLFFAGFDGTQWHPQKQILPGNSSAQSDGGPAMTVLDGTLYAAWKGVLGDQTLYTSTYSGGSWSGPTSIGYMTNADPALATLGNKVYAAWRGWDGDPSQPGIANGGGDPGLYWTWRSPGQAWQPQNYPIKGAQSAVGPSLATYGGKLYAAWRGGPSDENLYYASYSGTGTTWSTPKAILSATSSTGPALASDSSGLYAIWKGVDGDQTLSYAQFNGSTWSVLGTLPGNTGQDLAPQPISGLGDTSNYVMQSDCNPLTDVSVSFTITEEMIFEPDAYQGFSIQLNAYSAPGTNVGWQQYGFDIKPDGIYWWVDNFSDVYPYGYLWQPEELLWSAPAPPTALPVGATFTVSLERQPGDAAWNIAFATFTLSGLPNPVSKKVQIPLSAPNLAPIVGFQVDVVGVPNEPAQMSQGAGTITYSASSPLTPLDAVLETGPTCTKAWTVTGESANTLYGVMPASSGTTLHQSVQALSP